MIHLIKYVILIAVAIAVISVHKHFDIVIISRRAC